MSRSRRRYLGYIYRVINDYPALEGEFKKEERPNIASGGAGMPRRKTGADSVHSAAVKKMETQDWAEYEAVRKAIETIRAKENGGECLDLIRRVHFEKSHTLTGAAWEGHMSYGKAKNLRRGFVLLVARNLGIKTKE